MMNRSTLGGFVLCLLLSANSATAISVTFDGTTTITDNQIGFDFDPAIGVIQFDSTASGPLTLSGYDVRGVVNAFATGGSGVTLPSATVLSLTNFVADVNNLLPGTQVVIEFSHTYTGTYAGLWQDAITAEVANGNLQATFLNGGSSLAVAPGTDTIDCWQGFMSGAVPFPATGATPPISNPFQAAGGGSTAYAAYGHGPSAYSVTNPVVGGKLCFTLGSPRSQLILPTSADVAFNVVPEPTAFLLWSVGLLGMRRRAHRS